MSTMRCNRCLGFTGSLRWSRLHAVAVLRLHPLRRRRRPRPPGPRCESPGSFADNPILYFVMTDRFVNGNPSNDHGSGRQREATPKDDVATFHGGDLRGLTEKLNAGWFDKLGVNALWITAPYEQIHGWVVGGDKEFKHYAYHGYYALDYTLLDHNMGTPDDLRALVDAAHARGVDQRAQVVRCAVLVMEKV